MLCWIFTAIGLIGAAGTVFAVLDDSHGSKNILGDLVICFASLAGIWLIVGGFIVGLACSDVGLPGPGNKAHFDGARFSVIYVGVLTGLLIGGLSILLLHAKNSWAGGQD